MRDVREREIERNPNRAMMMMNNQKDKTPNNEKEKPQNDL